MRHEVSAAALALAAIAGTAPPAGAQRPAEPKFAVSYPTAATAIPALRVWLERQEGMRHAKFDADARADARDARSSGRQAMPYEADHKWSVVTETPRFVSLLVDRYDYTGGAHGLDVYSTVLWDKAASMPRTPQSLFVGADALSMAIRPAYCRMLDAERRAKRGGALNPQDTEFNACLDPVKETVILGSSSRDRFDRIGVIAGPYDAGPYAEGKYEVTLPVTPAVLAAVRPEWRGYFKVAGTP